MTSGRLCQCGAQLREHAIETSAKGPGGTVFRCVGCGRQVFRFAGESVLHPGGADYVRMHVRLAGATPQANSGAP